MQLFKNLAWIAASAALALPASAETIRTKVAILGGGVAGISAARNLTANGIDDFVIVEARDILGGRAQNAPFADTYIELGCNWVQGLGTNPINELRKEHGLKTVANNGDNVIFRDEDGVVNHTKAYNEYNDAYDSIWELTEKRLANNQVDISARTAFNLIGYKPKTPLEQAVEYYLFDWEMAENPEVSSTIYTIYNDNFTYGDTVFGPDSDSDRFVLDPRGFKHIFLEEAKKFLKKDDDRVLYNTLVTKIEYDQNGVAIQTNTSDVILADYAITTFSVGVLQSDDIEWSPRLPDWKLEGIYGFDMATYTKIFMNFPTQFWDDNQYTVWVDSDRRGYFNAWQNLNAPGFLPKNTSTNIFFATVTQDLAYQVEAMEDDEVKDLAMEVLRKMYGDDIPEPTDFLFPRWHSNPLFRGTYSNWPIGETGEHHVNMKAPLHNRVHFAGEAMSVEFYGFLQGAWVTGEDTAQVVASCIKNEKCEKTEYYPQITNARIEPHYILKKRSL
ncbi:amine oxidase [Lichtheimia hyalospora FSU 10163]|nr:amine oxidase [Lichtheimia hyalospora FSU 10163]